MTLKFTRNFWTNYFMQQNKWTNYIKLSHSAWIVSREFTSLMHNVSK